MTPATSPFKWNQYGFTLGGPVIIPGLLNGSNKLFFMANFEGFRLRNQQGVFMTMEFGWGGEGTQFHLLFGSRERPPLRGPVRYGVYKR